MAIINTVPIPTLAKNVATRIWQVKAEGEGVR
jgi:hypothetical protein